MTGFFPPLFCSSVLNSAISRGLSLTRAGGHAVSNDSKDPRWCCRLTVNHLSGNVEVLHSTVEQIGQLRPSKNQPPGRRTTGRPESLRPRKPSCPEPRQPCP